MNLTESIHVNTKTNVQTHIKNIENIIANVVKSIAKGDPPILNLANRNWKNCDFTDRLILKVAGETTLSELRFSQKRSRPKFTIIMHLLSKVHSMLLSGNVCNRREIYYDDVALFGNQRVVDSAAQIICGMLDAPPWELGLMASSKGLVAGPLTLVLASGDSINYNVTGGLSIPHDVISLRKVESSAKYILLVEKETIFQKLLEEDALNCLKDSLLITGKGFPDLNTRLLLKYLHAQLSIPILALVDCDPHGIAIMCVYRFGSLSMCRYAQELAVPEIRWLGIHPCDVLGLNVKTVPFTKQDKSALAGLISRPFVKSNPKMAKQLKILERMDEKAELENVACISPNYLTQTYIPNKEISPK